MLIIELELCLNTLQPEFKSFLHHNKGRIHVENFRISQNQNN
jgi:hypothetical protein